MEIEVKDADPDFDFLNGKGATRLKDQKKALLCKGAVGVLMLILFILLVISLSTKSVNRITYVECLYPLGGGPGQGEIDYKDILTSKECDKVLRDYAKNKDSQYWKDTEKAMESAQKYLLGNTATSVEYSKMVVFDIDETVLSNLEEILDAGIGLSNGQKWDKWVTEARAPAIPKALELYKKLREAGYSVVFLTGRHAHHKDVTARNLEDIGYGKKCPNRPSQGTICYHKLITRKTGDERDAVIYKSEVRGMLMEEDFELVGSIGDQWSDLLGDNRATGVFKMPNPYYYIP